MSEHGASPEDVSAWKAQQEAKRAARLRQLHSPAELWRMQQEALEALAKLRPSGGGKQPIDAGQSARDNPKT